MNYKISHPNKIINCEINLPASKSISNRLLIIQALSNNTITIGNISKSEDTINLKKGILASNKKIDINHSGTAFRFLTSYLSSIKNKEYILTGSKRIQLSLLTKAKFTQLQKIIRLRLQFTCYKVREKRHQIINH